MHRPLTTRPENFKLSSLSSRIRISVALIFFHLNSFFFFTEYFSFFRYESRRILHLGSKSNFTTTQLSTSFPYTNHDESPRLPGMFFFTRSISAFYRFWDTNRDESPISSVTLYIIDVFISLSFVFRSEFQ